MLKKINNWQSYGSNTMSIDAIMVLLLLLQKKIKVWFYYRIFVRYHTSTILVPYKYSEITTGAVPRYHTGSNFFYDTSSFFIFIFGYGTVCFVPYHMVPSLRYHVPTMYIFSFVSTYVREYVNTKIQKTKFWNLLPESTV